MNELREISDAAATAEVADNFTSIRMYGIQATVEDMMRMMPKDELIGAQKVLGMLSASLETMYFVNKVDFGRKSLVKTLTELWEISCEINHHKFPSTPETTQPPSCDPSMFIR